MHLGRREPVARRFPEVLAVGALVLLAALGGVIHAYLSMLLDIPRARPRLPEDASSSGVRFLRDLTSVQRLNDFAHLLAMFNAR